MRKVANIDSEELAEHFCTILNDWLSEEEMEEVNRRNSTPEYTEACATHDFCDPNQAMSDALEALGSEFHFDLCDLINSTWALARAHRFQFKKQSTQ